MRQAIVFCCLQILRRFFINNVKTKITDASGKQTRYTYNGDDNLIKVDDHEGKETFYVYNLDGRLIKITDGNDSALRQKLIRLKHHSVPQNEFGSVSELK